MLKAKHKEPEFEEDPPKPKDDDAADGPGAGHNSDAGNEELAEMIEEWCELQEKEDALIIQYLKSVRDDKQAVKQKAKDTHDIAIKAFNARAMLRMIERQDAPDVVLATNRLFKALPVGHNMDMLVVQAELDKIRAEKAAAIAAKAAEREAKKAEKKTKVQNQEVET